MPYRVTFKRTFFDGRKRWRRGTHELPDTYNQELLPKDAEVVEYELPKEKSKKKAEAEL